MAIVKEASKEGTIWRDAKVFGAAEPIFGIVISAPTHGDIAQLGERMTGSHEVRGSIPLISTTHCRRRLLAAAFFIA